MWHIWRKKVATPQDLEKLNKAPSCLQGHSTPLLLSFSITNLNTVSLYGVPEVIPPFALLSLNTLKLPPVSEILTIHCP